MKKRGYLKKSTVVPQSKLSKLVCPNSGESKTNNTHTHPACSFHDVHLLND